MPNRNARIVDRVLNRLKLRQLRLLIEVGRLCNIQAAAKVMNMSQPAATKIIRDLETDFEVQLFHRTNRGVHPTPFGEALIRHGKLIFAQVSSATQELDDLSQGNAGRVVVGTLIAASARVLPEAIDRLLELRPKVTVKVVEGTNEVLVPRLLAGEIDLIVGRLPSLRYREGVSREELVRDRVELVVRPEHPLAGAKGLGLGDLRGFGWVLPPEETSLRREIDAYFLSQEEARPVIHVDCVSYLTTRALLCARDLIGVMPAPVTAADIEAGTLARLDWQVPFGEGPVGVSYRSEGALPPAGRAFLEVLRDVGKG